MSPVLDLDSLDKDMLQVNAAIIAGALIFLTVSTFSVSGEEKFSRTTTTFFALGALMAFSLSSLLILLGKKEYSLTSMKYGFFYIFGAAAIYAGYIFIRLLEGKV